MNQLYDAFQDSTPLPQYVEAKAAKRSKRNAFLCAAVIFAALGFGAGMAWGGDTADFGGTGCQLFRVSGQEHIAELLCRNVNTSGDAMATADLNVDDLYVNLTVFHGPGDVPDHFYAVPPDGYVAEPTPLILDEWKSGTVRIYPFVGS